MRIQVSKFNEPVTLKDFVRKGLSGFDYDSGQLETLETAVSKQAEMFARLIELLVQKFHLTAKEVMILVNGYDNGEDTHFVE
jgi:hypothetical protein